MAMRSILVLVVCMMVDLKETYKVMKQNKTVSIIYYTWDDHSYYNLNFILLWLKYLMK